MRRSMLRVKSHSPPKLSTAFDDLESTIQTYISCSTTHSSRLSSMIDRARGIQGLVSLSSFAILIPCTKVTYGY